MKYTVVVKEITSSNGDFKRQRFNNVNKRIINFLIKHQFSFMVGVIDNVVNRETAKNYIEVYEKSIGDYEINKLLKYQLRKNSKEQI